MKVLSNSASSARTFHFIHRLNHDAGLIEKRTFDIHKNDSRPRVLRAPFFMLPYVAPHQIVLCFFIC